MAEYSCGAVCGVVWCLGHRTLWSWVRIPLEAWVPVCILCSVRLEALDAPSAPSKKSYQTCNRLGNAWRGVRCVAPSLKYCLYEWWEWRNIYLVPVTCEWAGVWLGDSVNKGDPDVVLRVATGVRHTGTCSPNTCSSSLPDVSQKWNLSTDFSKTPLCEVSCKLYGSCRSVTSIQTDRQRSGFCGGCAVLEMCLKWVHRLNGTGHDA
jgi:hypothetical protein